MARKCTRDYRNKTFKFQYLLEHAEAIEVMELIVNSDNLVILTMEAVEDHGLLVNSLGNEFVIEGGAVNGVVVVFWETGVVLHDSGKTVGSNWSWAVATSHGSHAGLD